MRSRWMSVGSSWRLVAALFLCSLWVDSPGLWSEQAATATKEPLAAESVAADGFAGSVAVVGVRLFDGERTVPKATVVFSQGKIIAVGAEVEVPEGAVVVAGEGKTLLPGFIDSHTHSWGDALERAVVFGVTTQLDMFTDPRFLRQVQAEQAQGKPLPRADMISAGVLATAPGGHGTQFGVPIPTLTATDQVKDWISDRVVEGSQFIKVVIEDGSLFGREIPTLDRQIVAAVIVEAKRHGLLAVTHTHTLEGARMAIESGTDGLAHLFLDHAADDELLRLAKEHGIFVVPTMTVLESATGVASGTSLVADERLAPFLNSAEKVNLAKAFPSRGLTMSVVEETVRKLRAVGVPILAGSDAPNPGTTHGASIHREMELLVGAGLTPSEALKAATAAPADAFGLKDRGRVAVGQLADLVLVEGDPTAEITATRSIAAVWKRGLPIDRPAVSAQQRQVAEAQAEASRPRREAGLVSDFESGVEAEYGFGWTASTDQFLGGKSVVELGWSPEGAAGSDGALLIRGEIREGFAYPWAGAMFFPGSAPMEAANLSSIETLTFDVRGAGRFRVLLFAQSLGQTPTQEEFDSTDEWRTVHIDLTQVQNLKMDGFVAFLISAGAQPGEFELRVDNVAFE